MQLVTEDPPPALCSAHLDDTSSSARSVGEIWPGRIGTSENADGMDSRRCTDPAGPFPLHKVSSDWCASTGSIRTLWGPEMLFLPVL